MKTISILGSGWLGFPLVQHFILMGHPIKASTRSDDRLTDLRHVNAEPFIIDIDSLPRNIEDFLQANVLIINIPSKNIDGFRNLATAIENSQIEKIIFVSSTSVYENNNKTITESAGEESPRSPLLTIENLFRNCTRIRTTIVRFGGLVGYSRHPGKFFSSGKIVQNPDSPVNLIYRDDCIGIISRIVELEAWGEVFNCCADTHPTKREFYTQAAKSIGARTPTFADSSVRSYKIISNQKVKQFLDYDFLYPDLMNIEFEQSTSIHNNL